LLAADAGNTLGSGFLRLFSSQRVVGAISADRLRAVEAARCKHAPRRRCCRAPLRSVRLSGLESSFRAQPRSGPAGVEMAEVHSKSRRPSHLGSKPLEDATAQKQVYPPLGTISWRSGLPDRHAALLRRAYGRMGLCRSDERGLDVATRSK